MIPHIHEKIEKARTAKAMTQEQLAKAAGVTKQTVCGYETGRSQPPTKNLKALANGLGVSIDYLLDNDQHSSVSVTGLDMDQVEIVSRVVEGFRKANERYNRDKRD